MGHVRRLVAYRFVCSRGSWRMEDFVTCLDVFSPFLFFNLPWTADDEPTRVMFERQWTSLRRALMCILRPETSKSLASQVAAYRRHIEAYATAAEEVGAFRDTTGRENAFRTSFQV